jgi:AcrR family transcriptional regulator
MEMGNRAGKTRLGRDDWASAALRAIARGGIDAVAVESLAAELGATKGSFYWHFENRDSLIDAALAVWEQRSTDAVIALLEREADPATRLRMLLAAAFEMPAEERATEIALLAKLDHAGAARTVQRVAERRISYMAAQFEALGWKPEEAQDRATIVSYLYVGSLISSHLAPKASRGRKRARDVELVFDTLMRARPL